MTKKTEAEEYLKAHVDQIESAARRFQAQVTVLNLEGYQFDEIYSALKYLIGSFERTYAKRLDKPHRLALDKAVSEDSLKRKQEYQKNAHP